MDHLCYVCLVLLCFHARLFVDALWSPAGEGLTSWLSFVMSNCDVVTFPVGGILGQVWCLIVSIPDLCPLSYIHSYTTFHKSVFLTPVKLITDQPAKSDSDFMLRLQSYQRRIIDRSVVYKSYLRI